MLVLHVFILYFSVMLIFIAYLHLSRFVVIILHVVFLKVKLVCIGAFQVHAEYIHIITFFK